jgi:hypothetical protein
VKKLNVKIKKEETSKSVLFIAINKLFFIDFQVTRRGKNWSEDETIAFIGIWADYYSKLTSGGKRHSSIYHSMADQLNDILSPRFLSAQDVKGKIGNLATEYRRKGKNGC